MAGVRTSVGVQDNLSPAFGTMATAINVCLGAFMDMQTATDEGFDYRSIETARNAMLDVAESANQIEEELRQAQQQQEHLNNTAAHGVGVFDGLVKKAMGLVGVYASFRGAEKVLETADEITSTTARIDMMNDGLQSTEEVMNMIYQSAQNARGSYTDMASAVAKLGNNAGAAFNNNTEQIIQFSELVQKQFAIAGASGTEASNAMLQLTQALGSGVLRGDELNSIFEQAPNLIRSIADYLDVSIGQIREMASEGQITADIVKNAMFANADEINQKFAEMPMTWSQVGTSIQNTALKMFEPVLKKISQLTQNEAFQTVCNGVIDGFATLAQIAIPVLDAMIESAAFVVENWDMLAPIIMGVAGALAVYYGWQVACNTISAITTGVHVAMAAAKMVQLAISGGLTAATAAETAAQYGLNAAMYACPVVWIIGVIVILIGLFYAGVAAMNKFAGTSISATGVIAGAFAVLGAHIYNDLVVRSWNYIAAFVNFFGNVFNDPVAAVQVLFYDLAINVIGYIANMASAIESIINQIPGVEVSITAGLDNFVAGLEEASQKVKDESEWVEYVGKLDFIDYGDAANAGYNFGQGIDNSVSDFFSADKYMSDLGIDTTQGTGGMQLDDSAMSALGDIAGNTGAVADSLETSEEDLQWIKDIAEREIIDRTVFRDIKVEMGGVNNTVNNMADLDGIGQYLADSISEQMLVSAEGV